MTKKSLIICTTMLLLISCRPAHPKNILRVFSPLCGKENDLRPSLSGQTTFLDNSLDKVGASFDSLETPNLSVFEDALKQHRTGFFLLSYTGHGMRDSLGHSRLCFQKASRISGKGKKHPEFSKITDGIVTALPKDLSGAVLILDACQSAGVDPSKTKIYTSVISSSPYRVGADSLFGNRLGLALREAAEDPNCDGLVTDQELFDALILSIYREVSVSEYRAYPKLRRNSPSHIPLPIKSAKSQRCLPIRNEMEALTQRAETDLKQIIDPLKRQLKLDPLRGDKQTLPALDYDFYLIPEDSQNKDELRTALSNPALKLREFPKSAIDKAYAFARFSIFTEVYEIKARCGYVEVTRFRDDMLLSYRPLAELDQAIPRRRTLSKRRIVDHGTSDATRCQYRYTREVETKKERTMVHCAQPEGQCFLETCDDAGAAVP